MRRLDLSASSDLGVVDSGGDYDEAMLAFRSDPVKSANGESTVAFADPALQTLSLSFLTQFSAASYNFVPVQMAGQEVSILQITGYAPNINSVAVNGGAFETALLNGIVVGQPFAAMISLLAAPEAPVVLLLVLGLALIGGWWRRRG